jgi:hypothetical protein
MCHRASRGPWYWLDGFISSTKRYVDRNFGQEDDITVLTLALATS